MEPIMREIFAVVDAAKREGVWVFNGPLAAPEASTVLRLNGKEVMMTDGPFTEAKEFIGGFMIIRVADLDAALKWGERLCRAVTLPIEVRPFRSH
jgi:hypothetical protein